MMKDFTVSIIGLGLMGGSLAYALKGFRDCKIIGYDPRGEVAEQAASANAIDERAQNLEQAVASADLTVFCCPPGGILSSIEACKGSFKPNSVVTDICGVKQEIEAAFIGGLPDCVSYIGIHPMAGKEFGGFVNATPDLFKNAGFIVVLPENYDKSAFDLINDMISYLGAGRVCVNDSKGHDRIIGYTSDLMHIAATSLCIDYPKDMTLTYTGGAFRDCTRVASIDAALWTDLLMRNSENIISPLDTFINNLTAFKSALENKDDTRLYDLLDKANTSKGEMLKL